MDRAPATVVAPAPYPVIEATVVQEVSRPIQPAEAALQSQFNMARQKPFAQPPAQPSTQTYDLRGDRRSTAPEPGTMLDIFA